MGSWNETCLVSGLPIRCGDRVKMVLLEKGNSIDDENCQTGVYPWAFFAPITVPVSGEYADYGYIDVDDENSSSCRTMLRFFQNQHVPIEQGKNQYHDIAVPKIDTWDEFTTALYAGRLYFKHTYTTTSKGAYKVFIREDVWNEVMKMKFTGWRGTTELSRVVAEAAKYFDEIRDIIRVIDECQKLGNDQQTLKEHSLMLLDLKLNRSNSFAGNFMSEGQSPGLSETLRLLETFMREGLDFQETIQNMAELAFMNTAFQWLRKTWHPTTGSGSQADDVGECMEFYTRMGILASNIIVEDEKKYGEYDEEDEEDEESDDETA